MTVAQTLQCVRRCRVSDIPSPQMIMEVLLDLQKSQRDMRDEMRERFDRLEARMDRLEKRMDELQARQEALEARQDAVEALLRQQTRRLDSLTVDVANMRHDLDALRAAVRDYHGAVIGHGIHITDLNERVRRIEDHLGLPRA
jgi:chromosome segregation ATPase